MTKILVLEGLTRSFDGKTYKEIDLGLSTLEQEVLKGLKHK